MGASHPQHSGAMTLEASAGLALACVYSSSDEYLADIIQERRAAGAYGAQWRPVHVASALIVAAAALLACLTL